MSVGVAPASGDLTSRFFGTGSGFTPNSTVTTTVLQPDGAEYYGAYTSTRSVDSNGDFSWSWRWDPGDEFGRYTFIAHDSSGADARATFTIEAPDRSHPAPLQAFDTASTPSLTTMTQLLSSPYRAVGVYIPVAPGTDDRFDKLQSNLTTPWVAAVRRMGWSIIPIYIGQQAPSACFPYDYWHLSTDPDDARTQGAAAADYAAQSLMALGIPSHAPVYYDMEPYSGGCGTEVLAFLDGWTAQLHADGYLAGVYGDRASAMSDLSSMVGSSTYHLPDAVWVDTLNESDGVTGLGTPADGLWTHHRINQYQANELVHYGDAVLNIDADAVDAPVVPPIAAAPVHIEPHALRDAVVGRRYVATASRQGGLAPYTWSLVSGRLPVGLSLDRFGRITGVPGRAGVYRFTVRVVDSSLPVQSARASMSISVTDPLFLARAALPHGHVGASYRGVLAATGGRRPYRWSIRSGALPPGIRLTHSGALTGTPRRAGRYRFVATVKDAAASAAQSSQVCTIIVSR